MKLAWKRKRRMVNLEKTIRRYVKQRLTFDKTT